MKKLVIVILFFCILPLVMGEILLEGVVEDRVTFKAGGHSFNVQYVQSTQSAIFKMDDMGGIMMPGECETRDNIKYCYLGTDYPNIDVMIESLEPDVTIERTFSTILPNINEEVTVTVVLKNEGSKRVFGIKYEDKYPLTVKISSASNTKTWEGALSAGEEETFTYAIKVTEVTSFDSAATLTYEFEGKETTKKSSTKTISVQEPFSVEQSISTEAADRDEIIYYNITITNKDDSNGLIVNSLGITLPSIVTLVDSSIGLKRETNKFTFKGEIAKLGEKQFWIKMKFSKVGEFKIETTADLEIFNKDFKRELEKKFNVGLSYILPILNVTGSVKSSVAYPLYISIKNYGKGEIKNVSFKTESDLFDNIGGKKDIAAGTTYKIVDKTLTAPYTEKDEKHNIKVSGSYRSSSGRVYQFEKSAQLIVEATPKIIQIVKEFNKEKFYPGDEIKVMVKLKNLKSQVINDVDVSDVFPKEIRSSLVGEVTSAFAELGPNQEVKAYSYSVIIPEDYKENEIEFKTLLNAKLDGELIILKEIYNIKIVVGENPNGTSEDEVDDVSEGGEVIEGDGVIEGVEGLAGEGLNETEEGPNGEIKLSPEQKVGLFKRMFGWVKGLFSFGKED